MNRPDASRSRMAGSQGSLRTEAMLHKERQAQPIAAEDRLRIREMLGDPPPVTPDETLLRFSWAEMEAKANAAAQLGTLIMKDRPESN